MVYDMTKRSTFENLTDWIKELKANAEPDLVMVLVGNKLDLCLKDPSMRKVTREEGQKLAEAQKALFEETSAVENINVKEVFENLMQRNFRV